MFIPRFNMDIILILVYMRLIYHTQIIGFSIISSWGRKSQLFALFSWIHWNSKILSWNLWLISLDVSIISWIHVLCFIKVLIWFAICATIIDITFVGQHGIIFMSSSTLKDLNLVLMLRDLLCVILLFIIFLIL